MIIRSGDVNPYKLTVNSNGEALTSAVSQSIQHAVSSRDGEAYHVIGDFATINNSTHTVLHIKNTSATKNMVVTFIKVQTIDLAGGTAPPSALNYWQIGINRTYASGGTAVTPVNMNLTSANVAPVTAYDNNATMAGTFLEIDRHYIQSEGESVLYDEEGSLIIGTNGTIEIRIVSSNTSGTALARVSFFMETPE